ncbi:hypothetical protein AB3480_06470 [Rhizobium mongolense]|uniref:hypothetical protein n=1 Tax=Rhizobium mongolense TaxID=57676 RepID=UPI0034A4C325
MTDIAYRNPVFSRPANAAIDMEIDHPDFGWIPFTASPDDPEEHGRELYAAALPSAAPYVAPPPAPYSLDKMVLWLRLSEEEANAVDAAMTLQSARLRGIWNTAQSVQSDSEFFGTLLAFLTAVIGGARANQVLAP